MTLQYPDHSEYSRRILLAVSGMSPQILTETLWALTQQRKPGFAPTEIHLVTTVSGARNARHNLLDVNGGQFLRFCEQYGLDKAVFPSSNIRVITTADGTPLDDIRTPEENEAAADFITDHIRALTEDSEAALHVSMAGGRKTMGYYAGYALSLFGRAQDRLSHVLVSEGFEGQPGFYFPTNTSYLFEATNKKVLDARDAQVTLAEIPFVRLRDEVPTQLLTGHAGFSETIRKTQRPKQGDQLVVDIGARRLVMAGEEAVLPPLLFAFYVWHIKRLLEGVAEPGVRDMAEPNKLYAEEFMTLFEQIEGEMGRDLERTRNGLRDGMELNWFREKISRINSAFIEQLGQSFARPYQIISFGKRNFTRYAVMLEADQIEWIDKQEG